MNLVDMRALVRRDLRDEDAANYRWTDAEVDRAIQRATKEFSGYLPKEEKATIATTNGSRDISISTLTNRIKVHAVEYPVGKFPLRYQRYSLYQDTITLLGDTVPDGTNCYIFWGKLHTIVADSSTIPVQHEDLVALGASAFAALAWGVYATDKVTTGGRDVDRDYQNYARTSLRQFFGQLKELKRKVESKRLYTPATGGYSQTSDQGP